MKIRNRIFYYFILLVISAYAAYSLLQKALISPFFRHNIIEKTGPALKADNFDVREINLGLGGLYLKDVLYEKENVSVGIELLEVRFSILESVRSLFGSDGRFFRARSVAVNGCHIRINPETRPGRKTEWKFEYDDFKNILDFMKDYDYVGSISIRNVGLSYISDSGLELITGMSGTAEYDRQGNIELFLKGSFLDPEGNEISLKGYIDNSAYSALAELDLGSNSVRAFESPFGLYKIGKGDYSGNMKLEINRYGEKKVYLTGSFSLDSLDMSFNDRVFLERTGLELEYINGLVSLKKAEGTVNGIKFSGQGRIMNILYPSGDIFLSTAAIPGAVVKDILSAHGYGDAADDILLGDDSVIDLHFTNDMTDPRVNFRLRSGAVKYKNTLVKDIDLGGYYRSGSVVLERSGFLCFNSMIELNGSMKNVFSGSPDYEMDIKSTGQLFTALPQVPGYLKKLSVIAEGKVKGRFGESPSVKAGLNAFDFEKTDGPDVFMIGLDLKNSIADVSLISDGTAADIKGYYDIENGTYSLTGPDIFRTIGILNGTGSSGTAPVLFFGVTGNRNFFHVRAGSEDPSSVLYGDLDARFDLGRDRLETFANWVPGEKNLISRPANFRFTAGSDTLTVSDVFFDSRPFPGSISVDLRSRTLSGSFEASGFDLGRFFNIKDLSTSTDMVLKIRGSASSPYADLYMNENILRYRDEQGDSLGISAEAELHVENGRLRIEKIILYEGISRIMTLSGTVFSPDKAELDAYGDMPLELLNPFFTKLRLAGRLKYKAEFTGGLKDIRLKNSQISLTDGYVNGDRIEKAELVTSEFDSTGVLVKKFALDAGRYLSVDAEGFIPYGNRDEIYVTGNFHGDLLAYLDKKTTYISDAGSECEGRFTLEGWYGKPKLKELELYVSDGRFTPKGSPGGFHRIRSKLFVDSKLKLDIIKLIMKESSTGADITVENSVYDKDYGDIILPGGINLGNLSVIVGEEGIDYNAYRLMLEDDYGNFVLKGKRNSRFRLYMRNGGLTLDGKAYLRNARITYPLLDIKEERTVRKKGATFRDIFGDLNLDVEIIPAGGNKYFYNIGTEESSLWKRFIKSFSTLDNELSNVNVNISSDSKGLTIRGNVFKPKELQFGGTVSGRNGTGSYSALTFSVDNVSVQFDGSRNQRGYTDPYLKASARTSVKTKIDSTGFSGYETVYLKVVTKDEDGFITDPEGARFSGISIGLFDEFGNSWLEKQQGISGIDTGGTAKEIFAGAVDTKLFSPILSPIENALGRFLGAQISIRPNVSGNFIDRELGMVEVPENYAEYFVGSEFFISKSLTDELALTWNSEYIGSEEYVEIADREYGYKNSLSFDYRLNNYVFTSAGYQYDSINEEYGYNLALTYRYRFGNISEPVDKLKRFLRMR